MEALKTNVDHYMKLKGIKRYSHLLVNIAHELGIKGQDAYVFAEREKSNFSKMLKGERPLKYDFIIPLEKIFGVSLARLLKEDAYKLPVERENVPFDKGFRYYAYLDDPKLYQEEFDLWLAKDCRSIMTKSDEFGKTFLDYLVEYHSINGVRYLHDEYGIKLRWWQNQFEFEKGKGREKDKLVITEIPYTMIGAGIGKFISDVIDLVETKKTTDIVDISNGSDENGIRIVLELKKGADVEKLKNILYKKTKLEDTFGVNMLAIADGRPEVMGLKSIIKYNVDFQYELAQRKYTTLLNKALEQKEIKEGLIKATNIIDLIIEIIRGSQSQKQVKACLVHGKTDDIKFKNPESEILAGNLSFTERQAQAILELRLSKLIGLEILALQKEYEELMDKIGQYEDILGNRKTMTKTIKKDLKAIKKEYALPRKTLIEDGKEAVFDENAFVEQEVVFVQDKFGYSKLLDPAAFDRNIESVTKENKYYFRCMNTDSICIFTDNGNVHQIKVSAIPTKKVREKGIPIDNLGNYSSQGESIVTLVSFDMIKDKKLLFTTKNGMIKLVDGNEFETNRKTMLATKLGKDDEVVSVKITRVSNKQISEEQVEEMPVMLTGGSDDFGPLDFEQMELFDTTASMDVGQEQELQYTREILVLQTEEGIFLRFPLKEVPEMKKATLGVKGIKLNDGDFVSKVYLLDTGDNEVVKCNGKTVDLRKLKIGKRGTKGVKVRASKA